MSRGRVVTLALVFAAACGDRVPAPGGVSQRDWLSESAYRFGDAMAGDALFGRVYVRVTADNRRVFALETFQSRVSIWTPDGHRLVDLGRSGQGPATHVWGVWKDELGVNYVTGRRLVPPGPDTDRNGHRRRHRARSFRHHGGLRSRQ